MIEVASTPAPLSGWASDVRGLYLELMGETSPVVDDAFGAVIPPPGPANVVGAGAVYEYFWSLGHPGDTGERSRWWRRLGSESGPPWDSLDDPAARVYMYFPTDHGWRAKEVVTSVKYLAPIREEETLLDKAAADFTRVQPALAGAGELAGKLHDLPEVGPVAGAAASVLAASSKVKLSSVPQAEGYAWSVAKVATTHEGGFVQGVVWNLPRKMFTELGGRITGSVAVTLIPAGRQGPVVATRPVLEPAEVLASAVMVHDGGHTTTVPETGFVRLALAPRLNPGASEPGASGFGASEAGASGFGASGAGG